MKKSEAKTKWQTESGRREVQWWAAKELQDFLEIDTQDQIQIGYSGIDGWTDDGWDVFVEIVESTIAFDEEEGAE